MAICTSNNTFGNFSFCLSNTFGITNIKHFFAFNMVKMQSCMMSFITTIHTTLYPFIIPEPPTNLFGPIVSFLIDSFPITWIRQSSFSHFLAFYRVIFPMTRFTVCRLDFIGISLTPPLSSFSLFLFLKLCFHNYIIILDNCNVNLYPCKPDIKELTYEEV